MFCISPVVYRQITGGVQGTGDGTGLFHILFGDLIACTEMVQPGDCGAILVDSDNFAVGLAFAGGDGESFFFPIQRVLDKLKVDLVTDKFDDSQAATRRPSQAAATPDVSSRPVKRDLIYISYSHDDKKWHKMLRKMTDKDKRLPIWDDTLIPKGANWEKEIKEHVPRARIMVMLVSPHFLSPDCGAAKLEIEPALEAAEKGDLKVLWIPVRASDFFRHSIGKLMAAHDPERPLENLDSDGQQMALQAVYERMLGTLGLSSASDHKYHAFISYRREEPDRTFAVDLVRKLEAAGYSIAWDERDFNPQATFLEEMERCVKESQYTLAVTSPRYIQSGNTQEEAIICKVLDMNDQQRRLIPLKLESVQMPVWLYNIVGIDFTGDQAFIDPFDKLKKTLGNPS